MTSTEYLSKKYGKQKYKGFLYLNHILSNLEKNIPLSQDDFMVSLMFKEVAKEFSTTSNAVERNINTFKNKVKYEDTLKNFIFENIYEYIVLRDSKN